MNPSCDLCNRAQALYEVANRRPDIQLGQVVLPTPELDFQIFERIRPRIRSVASNIMIYVTQGDRPLALSEQLHGYPRLGEAGNDTSRLEGVEVIDLSGIEDRDPTGHLYDIYNATFGDDLGQLLNDAKKAAARESLTSAGRNLWKLEAADETDQEYALKLAFNRQAPRNRILARSRLIVAFVRVLA